MNSPTIPFNKPFLTGKEFLYVEDAIKRGHISGDGYYTSKVSARLEEILGGGKVLLTTSCTHALEMAALLLEVGPDDEFILPSYTFVSTVNAFVLRGARPVFIDIREDTLNMDEELLEGLITPRSRLVIPVHYAGVACEMDEILHVADRCGMAVVEDAAQGIDADYKGIPLGTMGCMGTLSFHETKNIQCGEGGALIVKDGTLFERAEILREKGTNRSKFFRGEVDKYSWVDKGSSYLPSDMLAAFLYAQLERLETVTAMRSRIYNFYDESLEPLEKEGILRRPCIPDHVNNNYHSFFVVFNDGKTRDKVISNLKKEGILAIFHYVPLHTSPMGRALGYREGDLPVTEKVSERILRLPFFNGITLEQLERVVQSVYKAVGYETFAYA